MKALWKGSLLFGRVNIPIKLYSAIESQSLGFKLLHSKCKTPLAYQRWCSKCKKDIAWDQVIKGMKMPDGSFFTITKENIGKLKPEKSEAIKIVQFAEIHTISPIYFDAHYFVAPAKVTEKSYFLLIETLKDTKTVGIAQCVLREKEYVVAIRPFEHGLLMTTLNYEYEIRDIDRIPELSVAVTPRFKKEELKLAEQIVKRQTKKFDMSKFKDTFAEDLKEKIKRYAKGKKIITKRAVKAVKERTKAISLEDSLKESLEEIKPKRKTVKRKRA